MLRRVAYLLALLLAPIAALAQGVLTVATDQRAYAYGERIAISVTIANTSAEALTLRGQLGCLVAFRFGDFDARDALPCGTQQTTETLLPNAQRVWQFSLHPATMGLPRTDGPHVVIGYASNTALADTVQVDAPRFLGGLVQVGVENGADAGEIGAIQNALNAFVRSSMPFPWGADEIWEISGVSVEEANAVYATDPKFRYFEPYRVLAPPEVLTHREATPTPSVASHVSIVPHPCRIRCSLTWTQQQPGSYTLLVYDVRGRLKQTYALSPKAPGIQHVDLDLEHLLPGLYAWRLAGSRTMHTGTFLVVR